MTASCLIPSLILELQSFGKPETEKWYFYWLFKTLAKAIVLGVTERGKQLEEARVSVKQHPCMSSAFSPKDCLLFRRDPAALALSASRRALQPLSVALSSIHWNLVLSVRQFLAWILGKNFVFTHIFFLIQMICNCSTFSNVYRCFFLPHPSIPCLVWEILSNGALKSTCEKHRICCLLLVLFAWQVLLATLRPQILHWMDPCSDLCNAFFPLLH